MSTAKLFAIISPILFLFMADHVAANTQIKGIGGYDRNVHPFNTIAKDSLAVNNSGQDRNVNSGVAFTGMLDPDKNSGQARDLIPLQKRFADYSEPNFSQD